MPDNRVVPAATRLSQTKALLESKLHEIIARLPATIDERYRKAMGERILRVMLSLASRPHMANVAPQEVTLAAYRVGEIGLDPEPTLGQVYLIPFKEKLQIIIGYRGYVELGYRSERLVDIDADVVYPEDQFVYRKGREVLLEHIPNLDVERPDYKSTCTMRYAYAVAHIRGGGQLQVVLPRWEVMAHKARSAAVRAGRPTPWDTDEPAMWKKTAIRVLSKLMPQSTEIARALALDFDSDPRERADGTAPVTIDGVVTEVPPEPEPEEPPAPAPPPPAVTLASFDPATRAVLIRNLKRAKGLNQAQASVFIAERHYPTLEAALEDLREFLTEPPEKQE